MSRARGLAVTVLALALLACAAQPTVARERIPTEVSLQNYIGGGEGFKGEVESGPGCEKGRVIKLKYDAPSHYPDDSWTTRTNGKGKWNIEFSSHKPNPGEYQAIAKKREVGDDLCKQARSEVVDIEV
jgi:hypothetical protein